MQKCYPSEEEVWHYGSLDTFEKLTYFLYKTFPYFPFYLYHYFLYIFAFVYISIGTVRVFIELFYATA